MCHTHYMRLHRAGLPGPVLRPTPAARFWGFVAEAAGDCWEWGGGQTENGYGQFTVRPGASPVRAHRFAYQELVGEIPDGLQLDHLCRNRLCVNPWHLDPVPGRVNTLRGEGISARNARKSACVHGHLFTPENTYLDSRGRRLCRMCRAQARAAFRARQSAAA